MSGAVSLQALGIALSWQHQRRSVQCGHCGTDFEVAVGPAFILIPTRAPLCRRCAAENAPDLLQVFSSWRTTAYLQRLQALQLDTHEQERLLQLAVALRAERIPA